jgi:hypothetical protein
MMEILSVEEEYWRQRGRQQWVLKGDANTKFFHAFANGRKRKCAIFALQSPSGLVTDNMAIQEIIYAFYRDLMGDDEPKMLSTHPRLWAGQRCVSDLENEELRRSFTPEELDVVLKETKTDTAPGPDGLPVASAVLQEVLAYAAPACASDSKWVCHGNCGHCKIKLWHLVSHPKGHSGYQVVPPNCFNQRDFQDSLQSLCHQALSSGASHHLPSANGLH